MDLGAALVGLFTVLVVKVAVMVIATRILLRLLGAVRGKSPLKLASSLKSAGLLEIRVIWTALLLFWLSEITCGVEISIIMKSSPVLGTIHSVNSSTGMGLFLVGSFLLLDNKLIHLFDDKKSCIGLPVCETCSFAAGRACNFELVFKFAIVLLSFACIPLLLASTEVQYANVSRYILPFESLNSYYDNTVVPIIRKYYSEYQPTGEVFHLPYAQLLTDYRISPLVVFALSIVAGVLLRFGRKLQSISVFLFAVGVLTFSYSQVILNLVTQYIMFGALMHELAELWFLILTAEVLRKVYIVEAKQEI